MYGLGLEGVRCSFGGFAREAFGVGSGVGRRDDELLENSGNVPRIRSTFSDRRKFLAINGSFFAQPTRKV